MSKQPIVSFIRSAIKPEQLFPIFIEHGWLSPRGICYTLKSEDRERDQTGKAVRQRVVEEGYFDCLLSIDGVCDLKGDFSGNVSDLRLMEKEFNAILTNLTNWEDLDHLVIVTKYPIPVSAEYICKRTGIAYLNTKEEIIVSYRECQFDTITLSSKQGQ